MAADAVREKVGATGGEEERHSPRSLRRMTQLPVPVADFIVGRIAIARRSERTDLRGYATCRGIRFTVRLRSCTPAPNVSGERPARKQAMSNSNTGRVSSGRVSLCWRRGSLERIIERFLRNAEFPQDRVAHIPEILHAHGLV